MTLERDKRMLMAHILGCTYEDVFLSNPSPESIEGFHELWAQRLKGVPLARIMGKQVFRGLTFHISSHVLEPRVESEMIVEQVHADHLPDHARFLDLGTGSGCLIVAALKEFATSTGVGIDISQKALEMAEINGRLHGVNDRVTWVQSNWLENVPNQTFDIIMANPPYIGLCEPLGDDVLQQDPHLALYGGEDGLDSYRSILKCLPKYCHQGTKCIFEIGYRQENAMRKLLSDWHVQNVLRDANNHPRVVVFVPVESTTVIDAGQSQ